jgi:hypothetical protein
MKPKIKFYPITQNSEEWDSLRLGKFTASMFGDLFAKPDSVTYKKAILNVAYERITGESEERYSNKWMERGHEKEMQARINYEVSTWQVLEDGGFYEYNEFVGASPDAKIKGVNGGCEFKCPSFAVYHEYLCSKQLPKNYFWQVHGQMLCTGWDFVDFVPYTSPHIKQVIIPFERDQSILDQLEEKLYTCIKEVKSIMKEIKS